MNKRRILSVLVAFVISVNTVLAGITEIMTASVAVASGVRAVVTPGNSLVQESHVNIPYLNNRNAFTREPPNYYKITNIYNKKGGFVKEINRFKPVRRRRSRGYSFKTEMLLPVDRDRNYDRRIRNLQAGVLVDNRYYYTLSINGTGANRGRVIRYDYRALSKMKLNIRRRSSDLRKAHSLKLYNDNAGKNGNNKKKRTKRQRRLARYIKIGPEIPTGHGQTLSYNPATKQLWILLDNETSFGVELYRESTVIQQICAKTLKPEKALRFSCETPDGRILLPGRVMTFDKNGAAYTAIRSSAGAVTIFRLDIKDNKVTVTTMQKMRYGASIKRLQCLSYNAYNNKMYLVGDDSIAYFPLDKLGSLKPADISYINYNSKREFQSLTFDSKGYAYLLVIMTPELLKSTNVLI